jgi:NAD(P)-dependent dehydrogenase (short-subunit alcohol dehydrogenase family)
MDAPRMEGRVAIITGGTGALGQSVSRRFLAAGARVCVPYIAPEELEGLRATLTPEMRERLYAVHTDVADEPAFGHFVKGVLEGYRRVHILVNGVGGFTGGDLLSTSLAEWRRLLALNLTSAFIGCRGVLPSMTEAGFGRIINIASRAVIPPMGGFIAYTVAKAGIITLTQALAQEVERGITVNAVLPSTMDTPANRRAMPDADRSRWVSTDAVADVITFLASDRAEAVSGATISV